jgi:hypothetical protein
MSKDLNDTFVDDAAPAVPPTKRGLVTDQEIRASIEKPKEVAADVAVERLPESPKRLPPAAFSEHAECHVQRETNLGDALSRQKHTIKELLVALSLIAGSTARPADELSAIAANAVERYSKR